LLCHQEAEIDPSPSPERLKRLYFAAHVRSEAAAPDVQSRAVETFVGARGASLKTDHPLAKAALVRLGAAWPARLGFSDLLDGAVALAGPTLRADAESDVEALMAEVLMRTFSAGLVDVHAHVPPLAVEPGERPLASPLVRLQARDDSHVTTLLHTTIRVEDEISRYALQLMDGTRDRAALLGGLSDWVREQRRESEAPGLSAQKLDENLVQLARLGLLQPGPDR
jgi:hypothetical protein